MVNEKNCLKSYHDLACAEEGFLKQKSRVRWLKLGDHNTSFFHKVVKARNSRNSIKFITLANGCISDDPKAIKQEAVAHFQNVLCDGGPLNDHAGYLENLEGFFWSPQHLDILSSEVILEEIKKTMFSIADSKAPGPDGFSALFFKAAWSIIGGDVFFFFFWINKNLFPKGQSPTKNTHEVKKDPKKRKTDSTSLKTEEKRHQPEQKYT